MMMICHPSRWQQSISRAESRERILNEDTWQQVPVTIDLSAAANWISGEYINTGENNAENFASHLERGLGVWAQCAPVLIRFWLCKGMFRHRLKAFQLLGSSAVAAIWLIVRPTSFCPADFGSFECAPLFAAPHQQWRFNSNARERVCVWVCGAVINFPSF